MEIIEENIEITANDSFQVVFSSFDHFNYVIENLKVVIIFHMCTTYSKLSFGWDKSNGLRVRGG